jgi:WD40 repeat protein
MVLAVLACPTGAAVAQGSLAADEASEGRAILQFEKRIGIKDHPQIIAWSSDNRHLALKGFNDGRLYVYDANSSDGAVRVLADRIGSAALAWSPDGQTIVLNQQAPISAIRLLSAHDGQEIGRRDIPLRQSYENCPLSGLPIAFTDDGRSLWMTCGRPNATTSFPIALKLRLPDFVAEDRLMLDPPVSDEKTHSRNYSLARIDGKLTLSTITLSVTNVYESFGIIKQRPFATGFDLDAKAQWFPRFELIDDNRSGYFRTPQELFLFPDRNFALVRMFPGTSERPGFPHDKSFDRMFDGYDARAGKRIVTYGGYNDGRPESGAIGAAQLIPHNELMIGQWSRVKPDSGGLIVFNPRDGTVVQRIRIGRTSSHLAVSPDGQRLAHITYRGEIRLYRIQRP